MKTALSLIIFALAMLLSSSLFAAGDIDTLIQHAAPRAGGGVYALRMGYLSMCLFGAFWGCFVVFNWRKWDFVSACLSETKAGVSAPSGFRLFAYVVILSLCYGFTYNCVRKQILDTTQLAYMILFACALTHLVKVVEIFRFFRGGTTVIKDETTK